MKSAAQIQHEAFNDFERWQVHQDKHTRGMEIVQQAALYANDDEWHSKKSEASYAWRHADIPHPMTRPDEKGRTGCP